MSQFCPNYLILLPLDLIETVEDNNIKISIKQGLTSNREHRWHVVVNKTMANVGKSSVEYIRAATRELLIDCYSERKVYIFHTLKKINYK